ncbi:MAG: helix-turn-helix domain-containing protein [Salinarimonas sp.]|nr:helix-turn-helix domain-containing protein [Salinarimonas sp.]
MRSDDLDLLRELPLFQGISDAGFRELTQAAFLQRFPAQVTLINEGEHPDFLHVVLEGLVEMFARDRQRETVLTIVQPVSTFILAAVITDEIYLKSARTLVASRILMLPAASVRKVFAEEPAFARAIVGELGFRYREVVRELKNQKLRSGAERLAAWLLGQREIADGAREITIPFEKRVLASLLGMTPENLSRAFATLAAYDVTTSGRRIVIGDPAALWKLVQPSQFIDEWKNGE